MLTVLHVYACFFDVSDDLSGQMVETRRQRLTGEAPQDGIWTNAYSRGLRTAGSELRYEQELNGLHVCSGCFSH